MLSVVATSQAVAIVAGFIRMRSPSMCNQSEPADKGESPGESTHLEGMLNDLVNKGFLPSITEEQTRSLQDMYSQLHEENTEKFKLELSKCPYHMTLART
uniref:Uncharacterized protein n=1 Tax=Timema cristinae TaxID=61476 RepID=A0A7R9HD26_TIMCR|nr:unnamed protein product [Timema cristinae]